MRIVHRDKKSSDDPWHESCILTTALMVHPEQAVVRYSHRKNVFNSNEKYFHLQWVLHPFFLKTIISTRLNNNKEIVFATLRIYSYLDSTINNYMDLYLAFEFLICLNYIY